MRPLLVKTLAVMLVTGLVLAIIGSGVLVVALRGGIVPYFDQRIALDASTSWCSRNPDWAGISTMRIAIRSAYIHMFQVMHLGLAAQQPREHGVHR